MDLQSDRRAREYRPRLREAAQGRPSFAAYYIVAGWGCGTSCQQVALIDARSGAVHFAPLTTSLGNRHRLDSRLFIADAPEDISEYYDGQVPEAPLFATAYWLWDESTKRFRSLPAAPSSGNPRRGRDRVRSVQ